MANAQPLREACTKSYYSYYENAKLFTGDNFHPLCLAANGDLSSDGDDIVIENKHDSNKTFSFKTFHLSCKSDTYCGTSKRYGGIVLYKYNENIEWWTENRTHCKSGYVVIQDTDSALVQKCIAAKSSGAVHGAVYKNAFDEEVEEAQQVVGEGFAIQKGSFEFNSGVFNQGDKDDEYHDVLRQMCDVVQYCMKKLVKNWKDAGPNSLGNRNFPVKELAKGYKKK